MLMERLVRKREEAAKIPPVSPDQCHAINVGFELYIGIESKLSISIIGFDLELGEFCHDFHSISIPINHSGTHFNLPAISTSLK